MVGLIRFVIGQKIYFLLAGVRFVAAMDFI
jgi:hypothetical protein